MVKFVVSVDVGFLLICYIIGMQGYMVFEYLEYGFVIVKVDVYVFGVVVLEIFFGKEVVVCLEKDEEEQGVKE